MEDGIDQNHLRVHTSYADGPDHLNKERTRSPMSPAAQREQSRQLDDDLEMLRAERVVSNAQSSRQESAMGRTKSMGRSRSRTAADPGDDFEWILRLYTRKIRSMNHLQILPPNLPNFSRGCTI